MKKKFRPIGDCKDEFEDLGYNGLYYAFFDSCSLEPSDFLNNKQDAEEIQLAFEKVRDFLDSFEEFCDDNKKKCIRI
jgi:hypothetical protein